MRLGLGFGLAYVRVLFADADGDIWYPRACWRTRLTTLSCVAACTPYNTGQAVPSNLTAAFSDSRKAALRDTLFASSKLVAFLVSIHRMCATLCSQQLACRPAFGCVCCSCVTAPNGPTKLPAVPLHCQAGFTHVCAGAPAALQP